MFYVAGKRMRVDGKWREPGELVPEAATWHNIRPWLSSGTVIEVPEDAEEALLLRLGVNPKDLPGYRAQLAESEPEPEPQPVSEPEPEPEKEEDEIEAEEPERSKEELYELAKTYDIPGRSQMSKEELAEAVAAYEQGDESDAD